MRGRGYGECASDGPSSPSVAIGDIAPCEACSAKNGAEWNCDTGRQW